MLKIQTIDCIFVFFESNFEMFMRILHKITATLAQLIIISSVFYFIEQIET